jgi:RNA polymerase sigma factor (sigma-70 family)
MAGLGKVLDVSLPHPAAGPDAPLDSSRDPAIVGFELVYRATVTDVTAYFARRCAEPQEVADLTSETYVQAIGSLRTFDPAKGTARAWLFGIARRVYAQRCERAAVGRQAVLALAAHRQLGEEEMDELAARIDAQRAGRELLARLAGLSTVEREVLELVDLAGLTPREAANVLGVAPGAVRVRLFRARRRLRTRQEDR